ncbi:unnamed protein product [Ilex paraguariensis]|uniref:U6 snRNA phosphodiesterase n=1 Tax=Ilex paraguariensis TaxID=185542 RepID=A0ABC8QQY3_9AQUA
MEALRTSYGDTYSDLDSDPDSDRTPPPPSNTDPTQPSNLLPPPLLSLLNPPNSLGTFDYLEHGMASRVRSFPHGEGNYALHVYIPVNIPPATKKELAQFLKRVTPLVPGLHVVNADVPLNNLLRDDQKLEQVAFEREFHISLGRTVPIRVHQKDSILAMLRQKFQTHSRYWIDFNKWEVFVNDDRTRTFLSIEVTAGGLAEITKQIQAVNRIYKLHNLPEFYKDPRPHISIAWALGDIGDLLKRVVAAEMKRFIVVEGSSQKRIFTSKFSGIKCRIGNKHHKICKFQEE